jgi:hypothetical protein
VAKKKLLDDIKASPARYYRLPADVLRDRRFDDGERLEILNAWIRDADQMRAAEIGVVITDIERRSTPRDHAAE